MPVEAPQVVVLSARMPGTDGTLTRRVSFDTPGSTVVAFVGRAQVIEQPRMFGPRRKVLMVDGRPSALHPLARSHAERLVEYPQPADVIAEFGNLESLAHATAILARRGLYVLCTQRGDTVTSAEVLTAGFVETGITVQHVY